jgi:hypothetical protein
LDLIHCNSYGDLNGYQKILGKEYNDIDDENFKEFRKMKKSIFSYVVFSQNNTLDINNSADLEAAEEIGNKLMRNKFLPSEVVIEEWKATIRCA